MNRILKIICCIFLIGISIGCVRKEVLDDINLIEGIGFDSAEKGYIMGTVLVPVYLPDQAPKNNTFSAKAKIKKDILQDIQRQAADPIVTGSLEIVLFSKSLAEKDGILALIDAFQRDPGVGSGLNIAVVDGEAHDLLKGQYGIRGNATYISKLLEHNMKADDLPKSNLQLFLSDFYQKGESPYIPQLKKIASNKLEINGLSLFNQGKMVDFIPAEKMFFFKLLVDKYSQGMHEVKIDSGKASIRSIRSSHNFELTKRDPYEITIHLKINGIIEEFTGQDITPKVVRQLAKQFEEDTSKEGLKLIQRFRDKSIDPVGLGHFIKTQTRNFDYQNWKENQYQKLVVKIKPEIKITESGVIQ
ncbi:Ger(x)C family spore germination protein [Neobacillus sp. K501]